MFWYFFVLDNKMFNRYFTVGIRFVVYQISIFYVRILILYVCEKFMIDLIIISEVNKSIVYMSIIFLHLLSPQVHQNESILDLLISKWGVDSCRLCLQIKIFQQIMQIQLPWTNFSFKVYQSLNFFILARNSVVWIPKTF